VRTDTALMRERVRQVFALIDELTEELPAPSIHRERLRTHLGMARADAEASPEMSAAQMPLLVHAAIAGDEKPALPVAAACTLLYLGADLHDSMLDHELPSSWHTRAPAEVSLTATTLLAALPQLSIARLSEEGAAPARLSTLYYLFADTILQLNSGQHEDLLFPDQENISLEDSLAMVERKSGAANGLFARVGAVLATDDAFTIEAYAALGSCLGVAKQLINDIWGIWGETTSQDLLNGKRTFPVVHALSTLRREQREQLQRVLAVARDSVEHHDEVRALLTEAGSVRYTTLIVWLYQQRARRHLAAALPQGSASRELRILLDRSSLLPQPKGPQRRPND
jgi:geranylgeranyl diphosphate synthase, type I